MVSFGRYYVKECPVIIDVYQNIINDIASIYTTLNTLIRACIDEKLDHSRCY